VSREDDPSIPGAKDRQLTAGWPPALRQRDFRRFWLGLLISVTGTWMQRVAQGWLVWELTDRALYLGLVAACATLPMFLLSLPAGTLADRVRKRNVLLVTQSLGAVQAFALAALVYTGAIQVWHVMALAAFLGTVWAFDMPTRQAMVLELVSREDALNAISLNSSAFSCGRLIGPAVAGLLMAKAGFDICFAVNGLTFLAFVAALATIRPRPPASTTRDPMLREIGEGLRWARGNTVALALLAMIAVSSLYGFSYVVLLPVMAEQVFHVGPEGYGFLMSAPAAGALCVAFALTALGMGPRWPLGGLVTAGSLCFPVALMAVAAANSYLLGMCGLFFTGAGMMAFNVVANTMLQKSSPDELRGRVMGLRSFLFAGVAWLGDVQMGVFGEWLGVRAAILIGASVCLLAAAAAWWRVPQLRRSD
jgi:MFS family permease